MRSNIVDALVQRSRSIAQRGVLVVADAKSLLRSVLNVSSFFFALKTFEKRTDGLRNGPIPIGWIFLGLRALEADYPAHYLLEIRGGPLAAEDRAALPDELVQQTNQNARPHRDLLQVLIHVHPGHLQAHSQNAL